MIISHRERHKTERIGWLRAAVLGANDGIVSTASLVVGVAASNATHNSVLIAGLVAGALSMAAGEYVSVSSQADTEQADLARERVELATDIESERDELTDIYISRGLDPVLAREVALKLMEKDPLTAHARDELGITEAASARPIQAALTSALTFAAGAVLAAPLSVTVPVVSVTSLLFLAILGALAARTGGASILKGAFRVTFWGALAMGLTAGVGALFGTSV